MSAPLVADYIIYHKYVGGIEKSIPRITDLHHEACRVMTIGDH